MPLRTLRLCALALAAFASAAGAQRVRNGDFILAVVNQESVTAGEVDMRLARAREQAARAPGPRPTEEALRKQVVDELIEERVITTYARDSGAKVDEPELDRAVQGVAAQNQLTMVELRERLKGEGLDMVRFRANLKDMLMVERVREREVGQRIRITDEELDAFIAKRNSAAAAEAELNLAQVLVTVPEGATPEVVEQRRQRAEQALARIRAGESFEAVAKQISEDGNRQAGGAIGLRPSSRLPDLFVEAVAPLKAGEVVPKLVRSGAGFHVLKLLERRESVAGRVSQTRARHILLRTSAQLSAELASRRLLEYKALIESGKRTFEALARENSEDGSSSAGGDLGWAYPGQFVPEFEEAMNRLALGGISPPVQSRFGVHLIQVVERRDVNLEPKQIREQAKNSLREQKFEQAYNEWTQELRSRAYIEMREPPQ